MEVDVSGLEGIQRAIQQMSKGGAKLRKQVLRRGADHLADELRSNVPVDDGTYRDGIKVTEKGKQVIVHTGTVPHAHLVENGRSGGSAQYTDKNGVTRTTKFGPVAPNPVVARTYESNKAKIIRIMGDEVKRELGL